MAEALSKEKLIDEALERSIDRIYPSKQALEKAIKEGKSLRIYLGVDATGPHLHLGHLTNFLVLKRLQELGNEIIFLIGDFTGKVGDPTDKLAARKQLSDEEIKENLKTFKEQTESILNFGGSNPVKIRFNSEWLKNMTLSDVMDLASKVTVQQFLERDMFQERIKNDRPISLHEFMYPLLQGYDSVAMNVDGEVGGTDQTFNMLVGRNLQKSYNGKEKFVITTKLLVHPKTGKKLMNKSEGGMINLDDSPEDIFGKVMALDDESMFQVAEHCTEMSLDKIEELQSGINKEAVNPRDAKMEIAEAVTGLIKGLDVALRVKNEFFETFSNKNVGENIPTLVLPEEMSLLDIVSKSGLTESNSETRRLIEQGGVELDKVKKQDPKEILKIRGGEVLKVGKKSFFRIERK